jgi:hypothetical protein
MVCQEKLTEKSACGVFLSRNLYKKLLILKKPGIKQGFPMSPNKIKTASAGALLAVLLLSAFPLILEINAQSASSNLLVNSDFESGTLDDWDINGTCSISDDIVHSGSYSAYLSDQSYDSMMNQTVMLPATDLLYTEGWIYPTRVGNLGEAFCASAQINYYFYNKLSMKQEFIVGAVWSWNNWHANSSWYLGFLLPFNVSSWNYFSLNLTDAIYSHCEGMDFSNIVLYSVVAWYHFSNGDPGEFYVDDLYLSNDPTSPQTSVPLSPKPVNISISTSAESTELGYILDLNGDLMTLEGGPLAGKQVILSSMIPGTAAWNPFSSVTTDGNGNFSASWIPIATGNFMVKAEWQGDENYSAAYDIKNVSVLRGSEENVFMAESNSTLSSLSLNSTSNEISFTVSGPSGTTGYVRFLLSKSLLNDPADVKVYKDGVLTNCTVTSVGDQTILYITYSHSSHEMRISLPEYAESDNSENSSSTVSTILLYVLGFIVIAAVIALPLIVVALLRKPKSNQ